MIECTGVSATYCPVHGDCTCGPRLDGTPTMEDGGCPLHDPSSDHGEGEGSSEHRLRIALDLIESMTTALTIRTHEEWCRDVEAVLWAVRDIREQ